MNNNTNNKAKCHQCEFLDWNFFDGSYSFDGVHQCGLHGGAIVDPDGEQPDLDHHGGCGFIPLQGVRQYSIPPWLW